MAIMAVWTTVVFIVAVLRCGGVKVWKGHRTNIQKAGFLYIPPLLTFPQQAFLPRTPLHCHLSKITIRTGSKAHLKVGAASVSATCIRAQRSLACGRTINIYHTKKPRLYDFSHFWCVSIYVIARLSDSSNCMQIRDVVFVNPCARSQSIQNSHDRPVSSSCHHHPLRLDS